VPSSRPNATPGQVSDFLATEDAVLQDLKARVVYFRTGEIALREFDSGIAPHKSQWPLATGTELVNLRWIGVSPFLIWSKKVIRFSQQTGSPTIRLPTHGGP
jgi:hypothetical protein